MILACCLPVLCASALSSFLSGASNGSGPAGEHDVHFSLLSGDSADLRVSTRETVLHVMPRLRAELRVPFHRSLQLVPDSAGPAAPVQETDLVLDAATSFSVVIGSYESSTEIIQEFLRGWGPDENVPAGVQWFADRWETYKESAEDRFGSPEEFSVRLDEQLDQEELIQKLTELETLTELTHLSNGRPADSWYYFDENFRPYGWATRSYDPEEE